VHLASNFPKTSKKPPKIFFGKKLNRTSKHAEFYADFKSVEKVAKGTLKVCLKK
jgi:hypothetical protein